MKIAILIPSTTNNRDWESINETYLYKSIISFVEKRNPDYEYKFYIGVDLDDKIYSRQDEKNKIYELSKTLNVGLQFYPINKDIHNGYLTHIWNLLYKKSIEEQNDYFFIAGDDIIYMSDGWLDNCIDALTKTKGVGAAGVFNGNGQILTQFLVTKKHYDIFGFAYNPKIKNWFCDTHLHELYSPRFLHICEGQAINAGGSPRYQIDYTAQTFYKQLVEEDKVKLLYYIKQNGGLSYYIGNTRTRKRGKSSKSVKTN
jgi:hypothetical protein